MGKVPEYNLRAINKYNAKFDRIAVNLPKGTKERIKELTGKSCNAYLSELALADLDRLENFGIKEQPQAINSREIPEIADVKPEAKEIDLQALYEEYGKDAILSVIGQINIMEKYGNEVLQELVKYAKDQETEQPPEQQQDFSGVPFMN